MAEYTEKVTLPTMGLLDEAIPEEVTIRPISTKEEKLIYGSNNEKALDAVIRNCVVEPSDLDIEAMTTVDKHFLLMKLRILTYGTEYHAKYKCPECDAPAAEFKIDLDEFEVNYLPDDFQEPFEFELPVSGDIIGIKILRGKDITAVEKASKKLQKKLPNYQGDPAYILRMAQYIQQINGETLPSVKKQEYVESLHGRDSAYFWHKVNSIEIGYDTTVQAACPNPRCGEDVEFSMPMTAEFFRPRFDD